MRARFLTAALLCVLLALFTGCGGCGDGKGAGDSGDSAEGSAEETEPALRQMELLQFEDPETENLAQLLQDAGSGMMVQLQAGSLLGSGVIYGAEEDRLIILTAAHVLEETPDSVLVTFADGFCVSTGDFQCFELGDFAAVRVSVGEIPEDSLKQYCCANVDRESFDEAAEGSGCIVMGSRTGVAAEAYEGVVLEPWIFMEDYGQYMMWVRAEIKPGMSGGGLFDRQGHFLGILSGGDGQGELAVVPLSLILAEAETL